jgi:hypothetical protein
MPADASYSFRGAGQIHEGNQPGGLGMAAPPAYRLQVLRMGQSRPLLLARGSAADRAGVAFDTGIKLNHDLAHGGFAFPDMAPGTDLTDPEDRQHAVRIRPPSAGFDPNVPDRQSSGTDLPWLPPEKAKPRKTTTGAGVGFAFHVAIFIRAIWRSCRPGRQRCRLR